MKRVQGIKISALALGILLSLMFVFGCSELPNKPNGGEFTIADYEFLVANGKSVEPANEGPPETSNVTASAGGTVNIPVDRKVTAKFKVPANSVTNNVNITAVVVKTPVSGKSVLDFTFGPSGLVFSKDATLEIDISAFDDADMTYVNWYWYNPATSSWELEEVVPVKNGKVEIPVSHFSRYVGLSQGGQQ